MADVESLEIQVDTDVHVPSKDTPPKVMAAIRRQLRQHDLGPASRKIDQDLPGLIETRGGVHRLPQALLPRVTETCQRYGIAYQVIDRRSMVSCPSIRSLIKLTDSEQAALDRLLLRDSGVVVSSGDRERVALAVGLTARRQQRTLVATETNEEADLWITLLRSGLDIPADQISSLEDATPDSWIVAGTYGALLKQPEAVLQRGYGMVICDGLTSVDAVTLIRTIRSVGARYMLGLAREAGRPDSLHNSIFLSLGGVTCKLPTPAAEDAPLRLRCRFRESRFGFPYEGRRQYQAMIAALAADEDRNQIIAADIAAEAAAGQHCLVLSERRDHLENLARLLSDEAAATITSAVPPARRAALIEQFDAGETKVLLITSQIALGTVNTSRITRLFLAFPFSYTRKLDRLIENLLHRAPAQEDAAVHDYDDAALAPLHRAFDKRRRFLETIQRRLDQEIADRQQLKLPF